MGKNTGKWAAGALLAGVVGYAAGILTAPKAGKETRKDIKDAAGKARAEAEKALKNTLHELNMKLDDVRAKGGDLSGRAKEEYDKVYAGAVKSKNKVREVLSALHDGDADDPELKTALHEAKEALKHLKKYAKQ